jgi:5-formyltetrahydrofolate cyclo-ligase
LRQGSEKASIRKLALKKRQEIPPQIRGQKSLRIKENLFGLREFKDAKIVLFFASFRDEVETIGMIKEALDMGKRVYLPKVEGNSLGIYEIEGLSDLKAGFMGIPEPEADRDKKRDINQVNVIIVPGAAFDTDGNRLGYGKGYYDRLLRGNAAPLIALAFEEQVFEGLPSEPHDVRMDIVVTEKRIIWTKKR